MSAAQKRSYEALSSRWRIPFRPEPFDPGSVFGNGNPVTVEIGFGMGEATVRLAEERPGMNYLGVEVYRAGIGKLLSEIEKRGLENIRIVEHDAAELVEWMAPSSVSAFHIFFPDPWPKKRHHKRRLVTRPFTEVLADTLIPGGYIYMVTDWEDYGEWALGELTAAAGIVNAYEDFAPSQSWRPRTRFEEKGLAKNHTLRELYFVKPEEGRPE
jgi:tRNA (guanine-N7-)-methyltransferase